jgi:hypothetical protein
MGEGKQIRVRGNGEERRGEERRGAGLNRGKAQASEIPVERWRQRSVAAEAERAGKEREGGREGRREGGEGRGVREEEGAGRRDPSGSGSAGGAGQLRCVAPG